MVRLGRPAPKPLAVRSPQIDRIHGARLWLEIIGYLAYPPTAGLLGFESQPLLPLRQYPAHMQQCPLESFLQFFDVRDSY